MALDADVRRLTGVRPFDSLPREAVQLIAFASDRRRLKAGETLFEAGDAASGAFFVVAGEIVLRAAGQERRAPVGALIGEMALLVETLRPALAIAEVDSELLQIARATFWRVLAEFPKSAAQVRRGAVKRTAALLGGLEVIRRRSFADEGEP